MSRTKIELWIGGKKADLSDASFILMNWTQEDLQSPAVVRNSFSKQITLPGTPTNNDIFGGIFRNDRVTQYASGQQTGVYFDPTRKTDFRIYNERSEIIESGYLRLNSVSRQGAHVVDYKVTLYGGLGSFIYGLSYEESGEKKTLASLNYQGLLSPADEFNFTLNRDAVAAAWARRSSSADGLSTMWDYINFAPCYNGLPNGTFDAKKGIVSLTQTGIGDPAGTESGQTIVTMTKDYTEWMVRDLRSYLQRPVIRMRAILAAIASSANNGGWTVNLNSAFFNNDNPYYNKTWLTLPIIETKNEFSNVSGHGTLEFSMLSLYSFEAFIQDSVADYEYNVSADFMPFIEMRNQTAGNKYLHCESGGNLWMNVIGFTLTAYDVGGNAIAATTQRLCSRQAPTGSGIPEIDYVGPFVKDNDTTFYANWNGSPIHLSVSGRGIYRLVFSISFTAYRQGSGSAVSAHAMWDLNNDPTTIFTAGDLEWTNVGTPEYNVTGARGGRSNKPVTKATLLGGTGTPADYLLGFCKTFGLVMVADIASKTVEIMPRTSFYNGGATDIEDRIDRASVTKEPFSFSARWYVWDAGYQEGEWAKVYKEKYGRAFASMRVDTGFSFDNNTNEVMSGNVLKGGVMALENSKYYCTVTEDSKRVPSVLLDRGAKYRIESGSSYEDVDVSKPGPNATIDWLTPGNASYDLFPKVQFHGEDNKATDGANVLLFFTGMLNVAAAKYSLTDDNSFMLEMNNGTPCWLLNWTDVSPLSQVSSLPLFSRYIMSGTAVQKSLDFGTPAEVPFITITSFASGSNIFDQYWKKYITDRYDDDSAVVRCKVDLRQFMVGNGLLRSFWYFDNAYWALNRIINHSVTTDDLTECEFVKVQDMTNYTT